MWTTRCAPCSPPWLRDPSRRLSDAPATWQPDSKLEPDRIVSPSRFPSLAPKHVYFVNGAPLEWRPFRSPLIQCLVLSKARIPLNGELVVLQCILRPSGAPIAEHKRVVVVMRPVVAEFRRGL